MALLTWCGIGAGMVLSLQQYVPLCVRISKSLSWEALLSGCLETELEEKQTSEREKNLEEDNNILKLKLSLKGTEKDIQKTHLRNLTT